MEFVSMTHSRAQLSRKGDQSRKEKYWTKYPDDCEEVCGKQDKELAGGGAAGQREQI